MNILSRREKNKNADIDMQIKEESAQNLKGKMKFQHTRASELIIS